jgi:periplasmic divalent cation tolerance protein
LTEIVFLYATAPDAAVGARIAEALVESRAAACVNLIPTIRSVYRWQGAIARADEAALIVKTTAASAERARAVIRAAHPHDTPAIAAWSASAPGLDSDFAGWIARETAATD